MYSPLVYLLKLVIELLNHYIELHAKITGHREIDLNGLDITTEIDEALVLLSYLLSKFEDSGVVVKAPDISLVESELEKKEK
jgi:hypothetical protein